MSWFLLLLNGFCDSQTQIRTDSMICVCFCLGRWCAVAVWHCYTAASVSFLIHGTKKSRGKQIENMAAFWKISGCLLKLPKPVFRPFVELSHLCRCSCWVATRWQPVVQTGWLSTFSLVGVSPEALRGKTPFKADWILYWQYHLWPMQLYLIDTWSENFTLGILCLTLQTRSLSIFQAPFAKVTGGWTRSQTCCKTRHFALQLEKTSS